VTHRLAVCTSGREVRPQPCAAFAGSRGARGTEPDRAAAQSRPGLPRRTAGPWKALARLVKPLDAARAAVHHHEDVRYRRAGAHAVAVVLRQCAATGPAFWGWTGWDRAPGRPGMLGHRPAVLVRSKPGNKPRKWSATRRHGSARRNRPEISSTSASNAATHPARSTHAVIITTRQGPHHPTTRRNCRCGTNHHLARRHHDE
jgi:hypothetical protein